MPLTIIIAVPLLLAATAPLLRRLLGNATGPVLAMAPLASAAVLLSLASGIANGAPLLETVDWVPSLGIALAFRLDGLGVLFALLITVIGAVVLVYAQGYLHGDPRLGRFYTFLLLFMAAMLGVVLAENILTLFVFWELTSISSYLLIGHYHEKEEARKSALQALLITGAGGLALLAGLILLGDAAGGYSLSSILDSRETIIASDLYLPMLLLILLGAFTKSAQVPFQFWLPGAMAAPAPVSAYLHSATMVKAGVFVLARLSPAIGGTEYWHYIVTSTGAVTMIVASAVAYTQTDLKRLLAYSTVSALGTLVLLLGIGTDLAAKAAMVFLLVHSLYKGALFMVAGSIDHEAGTRDVRALGGLRRVMPITATAAALAALSMTGVPPLLGFISKELMYEAKMQAPQVSTLVLLAGVLANALTIAVAVIVGIRPFLGKASEVPAGTHEGPPSLWLGPLLLGALGLLFGLFPALPARLLIEPAVTAIRAEHIEVSLALWHGINPVLLLSIATVALGILFFYFRRQGRDFAEAFAPPRWLLPSMWYQRSVAHLPSMAGVLSRFVQSGYLRNYMIIVLLAFLVLMLLAFLRLPSMPVFKGLSAVALHEWGVLLIMVVATAGAMLSRTRLSAVVSLGVVGFGMSLVFLYYGAPDLAITQILIETLTVIIFVLVVYHLPKFSTMSSRATQLRDGIVALAAGGMVTLLALLAADVQVHPSISDFHARNSVPEAFGKNVVNVILVDFRALDTLGEITVLAVAALGVYAMIKLPLKKRGKSA